MCHFILQVASTLIQQASEAAMSLLSGAAYSSFYFGSEWLCWLLGLAENYNRREKVAINSRKKLILTCITSKWDKANETLRCKILAIMKRFLAGDCFKNLNEESLLDFASNKILRDDDLEVLSAAFDFTYEACSLNSHGMRGLKEKFVKMRAEHIESRLYL